MSVLIKGMEMPDSCHVCVAGYGGCCFVALPDSDGVCPDHGRADFCPLVPIQPHGRLIDADALIEALARMVPWAIADPTSNTFLDGLSAAYKAIQTAPTVIEAEGGE